MSKEEVVHLNRSQAHHIREELLIVRQRLLDEKPADRETDRIDRLYRLIERLDVPDPPRP